MQAQRILAALPPESAGFTTLDAQNPWVAAVQLSDAWALYQPHVVAVLRWLLPVAALGWVVISGLGRSLVLKRMEPGLRFRPLQMIVLAGRMAGAAGRTFWGWFRCHAMGGGQRTSTQPASRTWWATPSGRSFFRWDSSRLGRW